MARKVNDKAFVAGIKASQTHHLTEKYKATASDAKSVGVLDRVLLMTPENIHLNSFMYEPIVDMSDDHLKKLYKEVKKLT